MYSELSSANEFLTSNKMISCQAFTRLAVKHLFRSIQAEIRANEYLLVSIRKMKRAKATEVVENPMIPEGVRSLNSEVRQCLKKVAGPCQLFDPKNISDHINELMEEDIDYRHTVSLITADEIEQDVNYFTCAPIDIISSCHGKKPYEKTISEVRDAMCPGGHRSQSDELIDEKLRAVDCTNIRQICGIDAQRIHPDIARWSNLVWFQCPWTKNSDIPHLILGFLGNAAENCAPGTYVCVGITTKEKYMYKYSLEHIIWGQETQDQYDFLGPDCLLIEELLSYRYRHECCNPKRHNIHKDIYKDHVTLVFRLKTEVCSSLDKLSLKRSVK